MSNQKEHMSAIFKETPPFLKIFNITDAYPSDDDSFIVEFNPGVELTHTNGMVVQGGFVTGMLDCCMAQFLIYKSKGKQIPLTLDIDVKFLRPCAPGPIKTVAKIIKEGRSICFTDAVLYQNDKLIAISSATNKMVDSPF
ncbi:MAG: PaaI family thioesterase [Proteobacteria bacterium]|nr:PaaI family thioesterase [Pseudomonadota bacterium]MDA1037668.1 PaaI family thioesterase [Pseudomonadota bacterium]